MPKSNKPHKKSKPKKPAPSKQPKGQTEAHQDLQAYYLRPCIGDAHYCYLIGSGLSSQMLQADAYTIDVLDTVQSWLRDHGKVYCYHNVAQTVFHAFTPSQRKGMRCYVMKSDEDVAIWLCRDGAMMLVGYGPRVHRSDIYLSYVRVDGFADAIIAQFDDFVSQYQHVLPAFASGTSEVIASMADDLSQVHVSELHDHSKLIHAKNPENTGATLDDELLAVIDTVTSMMTLARATEAEMSSVLYDLHQRFAMVSPDYYIDYHVNKQSLVVYCPASNDKRHHYLLAWGEKQLVWYMRCLHGRGVAIWSKMAVAMQYFPSLLMLVEDTGIQSIQDFMLQGYLSRVLGALHDYCDRDEARAVRVRATVLSTVLQWLSDADQRTHCLAHDVGVMPILWRVLMHSYLHYQAFMTAAGPDVDAVVHDANRHALLHALVDAPYLYRQADLCMQVHAWLFTSGAQVDSSAAAVSQLQQRFVYQLANYCQRCSANTMAAFPDHFLALCLDQGDQMAVHMSADKLDDLRQERKRRQQQAQLSTAQSADRRVSSGAQVDASAHDDVHHAVLRARAAQAAANGQPRRKPAMPLFPETVHHRLLSRLARGGHREGYWINGQFIENSLSLPGHSFTTNGCQDSRVIAVCQLIDQGEPGHNQLQSNAITTRLQTFNRVIRPIRISNQGPEFLPSIPVQWRYDPRQSAYLGFWQNDALQLTGELWLAVLATYFAQHYTAQQASRLEQLAQAILPMFLDKKSFGVHFDLMDRDQDWIIQQTASLFEGLSHLDFQAALLLLQQDDLHAIHSQMVKYFEQFIMLQVSHHPEIHQCASDYVDYKLFSVALSHVLSGAIRIEHQSQVVLYIPDIFHDDVNACYDWMTKVVSSYYTVREENTGECISMTMNNHALGFRDAHVKACMLLMDLCAKLKLKGDCTLVNISCRYDPGVQATNSNHYDWSVVREKFIVTLWYKVCYLQPQERDKNGLIPMFVDLRDRLYARFVTTLATAPVELFVMFNALSHDDYTVKLEVRISFADARGQAVLAYDNQALRAFMLRWRAYLLTLDREESKWLAEILHYCDGSVVWDWTPTLMKRWASLCPMAYAVTCALLTGASVSQWRTQLSRLRQAFHDARRYTQDVLVQQIKDIGYTVEDDASVEQMLVSTTYNSLYMVSMHASPQSAVDAVACVQAEQGGCVGATVASMRSDADGPVDALSLFSAEQPELGSDDDLCADVDPSLPVDSSSMQGGAADSASVAGSALAAVLSSYRLSNSQQVFVAESGDSVDALTLSSTMTSFFSKPQSEGMSVAETGQGQVDHSMDLPNFTEEYGRFFTKPIVLETDCNPCTEFGKRSADRLGMLSRNSLPTQDHVMQFSG